MSGKSVDAPNAVNSKRLIHWILKAYLTVPIASLGYTISIPASTGEISNLYNLLELTNSGYKSVWGNGTQPKKIPQDSIKWLANQIKNNAIDSQTTLIAKDLLQKLYTFNTKYGAPFKTAMDSIN